MCLGHITYTSHQNWKKPTQTIFFLGPYILLLLDYFHDKEAHFPAILIILIQNISFSVNL